MGMLTGESPLVVHPKLQILQSLTIDREKIKIYMSYCDLDQYQCKFSLSWIFKRSAEAASRLLVRILKFKIQFHCKLKNVRL